MERLLRFFVLVVVFMSLSVGMIAQQVGASNPLRLQWPVVMPYASGSFDGVNGPHTGIDIITTSNPKDHTIVAATEGRVRAVKFDSISGNVIKIEHTGYDGGTYYTWYGHLSGMHVVENQSVTLGQKIGTMGCTGKCEGTHLHFQVMLNSSVMVGGKCPACLDPCDYLVGVVSGAYGSCGIDGDQTGIKRLVQREFTVERTNPTTSEEVWFSTKIENNGEVNVYIDTVFLRLTRGGNEVIVYGWRPEQGTVTLAPGESRVFDLRAPPINEAGLWRIQKVEVRDTKDTWFELGSIGSHLMVGPQSLIKDHYAQASSEQPGSGNGPQRANDGNMRTRWESEWKDDQWLLFDLDSTQIVDTAIVRSEAAFPLWFDVLVQEEGKSEWILVVKDLRGLPENSTYISFSPHSARKIKFEFRQRGTEWGHSIREIEVYRLSAIGAPLPTDTPIPTSTPAPIPTATEVPPTVTPIPDTTDPEDIRVTSPVDNEYIGTGWFNATAYATDSGSGVKVVEFHFEYDGVWHVVSDWSDADGWSASFDASGISPQNNMRLLLHVEDNAGNRAQSGVISRLTNVAPMCLIEWKPTSSINVGTITVTAGVNGWWNATVDGVGWTDVFVENGRATKEKSFEFVPNEITHHYVELWYPNVNGTKRCSFDAVINDLPEPTNTPTSTATSTATPTRTPTSTLVATSTPTETRVPTVTSTKTPFPTPTSTKTSIPTVTPTPTGTKVPTSTVTPTPSVTDPMSGVIEGTIIDEIGVPVRGVDVQLWRDTQSDVMYWSQWVEDGTYRFYGLPYSTWTVVIFNPTDDEYWKPVDPQIVVIDAQHLLHEVNFTLVRNQSQKYQLFIPLVKR